MKVNTIYRGLAVCLLGAMAMQRYHTLNRPVEVTRYHKAIRDSAADVPAQFGGWIGRDVPVPVQAVTLLQPNLLISRNYVNVESGRSVSFLLVHCSDAHDMAGHFPKRCYPADGWKLLSQTQHDWQADGRTFTGMEYRFSKAAEIGGGGGEKVITVANFLLRPGGHVLRDMDQMMELVRGAGGQASGAAQVQVCFDGDVPDKVRDETVRTFLGGYRPVIEAILADADH